MDAFIFQGSKGGSGRTASSVILATGLAALGHRPLHLQVTLARIRPVIATARGLPFSATWLPEDRATIKAIEAAISAHPKCSITVVDMTRQPLWELALTNRRIVALLPMRRTDVEIDAAIRDYRAIREFRTSFHSSGPNGSAICAHRILPITWPICPTPRGLSQKLSIFDDSVRGTSEPAEILTPGIPELPSDDLADLINGTQYKCSARIADAAVLVSRAAAQLLESEPALPLRRSFTVLNGNALS